MLMAAGYDNRQVRDRLIDQYHLNSYEVVLGGKKQGKFVNFVTALEICKLFERELPGLEGVLCRIGAENPSEQESELQVSFSLCCITALTH